MTTRRVMASARDIPPSTDFRLVPRHVHLQKVDAIDALLGDQIVEGRCFHR